MCSFGRRGMPRELPPLVEFENPWSIYEDRLYDIYIRTLVDADIRFRGCKVSCKRHPESNGKAFAFWHLISEGEIEEDRIPNIERCERITWISWCIENIDDCPELSWWKNKRRNSTHVVIWHEAENFVVILAERNGYYLIKTAYRAQKHRARSFRKEREKFWASQKD